MNGNLQYLFTIIAIVSAANAYCQGGPYSWRFGENAGIQFISGASLPVAVTASSQFRTDNGCASVCNNAGQLLFFTNGYWIYDRNGQRMPSFSGGQPYSPLVYYSGGTAAQNSLIVPFLNDTSKFYVFCLSTLGQLNYSVVDMTLNSGMGDVVPGKRSILTGYNLCEKMTAVAGCNNIWVVVRSMNSNCYYAYSVTDTGVVMTPVVSNIGNLGIDKYRCGVIKFSPDGRKMAAASYNYNYNAGLPYPLYGGLELYDFDPFSGKLSNALTLDSTRVYYGACFSGDGSKLYASAMEERTVYQWDVGQPSSGGILSSQTLVLTNPTYYLFDFFCACWIPIYKMLGDLQRGPDGKIYIANNSQSEAMLLPSGQYSYNSTYLHVFHQPDQPGLLCQPQVHAVYLNQRWSSIGLPNDVVPFPKQDTLGHSFSIVACFRDSILVAADTGKEYLWQDGITRRGRTIRQAGTYSVRYTGIDCALHLDTFIVSFPKLPVAALNSFSCPGASKGTLSVKQVVGDTTTYSYRWKSAEDSIIRITISGKGDTIRGLDTGAYYLQIKTASGCDTILPFYVQPLPVPEVSFEADSIVCTDETIPFWNTGEGVMWRWTFGDGDSSAEQQPVHSYNETGFYTVVLTATNEEGCSNAAAKKIEVKDFDITLLASGELVRKNSLVWLTTSATELYEVLAWRPEELFAEQNKQQQEVKATDSRYYTVIAQSQYGCMDSASIQVRVHPVIFMPTVFSPNGDGKNDLFHPVVSGEPVKVRYFQVYDRWGKMVWKAGSNDPAEGWDGTYAGTPAELGTYFYFINIETATGETFQQKGDVSLIR